MVTKRRLNDQDKNRRMSGIKDRRAFDANGVVQFGIALGFTPLS